jgi:RNA polymerase sigma-70 factor, ECF subfamily
VLGIGDQRRSDSALVERARGGDRRAFELLVERHRNRVWAVALRMTRDPDDAEDVLQDAFVSAWRALPRFDGRARFSTWLFRIVVNAAHDALARRRPTTALDDPETPEVPEPRDPYRQSAEREALERAIAALGDEYRMALLLCDVAGLGAAEAAELLDVPAGTVKSRVFRGREQVARALAAEGHGRGDG